MHDKSRATSAAIGALFLLATAAYATGSAVVAERPLVGSLLEFADAVAVAAIGLLFYGVLARHSAPVARVYVATRLAEAALLSVSIAGALLANDVLYECAFAAAMLALGLGSLPFTHLLYRIRLVPRAIAALGFVGYAALALWALLSLAGVTAGYALFAPGAAFEILFPLWLLAKGFRAPDVVGNRR